MFRVEVVASPTGEASATVGMDAEALLARRGLLQQAVLASAVPSRRVLPETEQPVREVGELLFAGLPGPVRWPGGTGPPRRRLPCAGKGCGHAGNRQ